MNIKQLLIVFIITNNPINAQSPSRISKEQRLLCHIALGETKYAHEMIQEGAQPNKTCSGWTALSHAINYKDNPDSINMIKMLLQAGATPKTPEELNFIEQNQELLNSYNQRKRSVFEQFAATCKRTFRILS